MKAELLLQLSDYISYKYSCCVVYHHQPLTEIRNHFNQKAQTRVGSATISPAFKLLLHLSSLHVQLKTKRATCIHFFSVHCEKLNENCPSEQTCFNDLLRVPGMVPGQPQRASLAPPLEQKEQQ